MTLTYVFHSCFVAETDTAAVVFDYWRDNLRKDLQRLLESTQKQVYFVVSHAHPDHYSPAVLRWAERLGARCLLSYDVARRLREKRDMAACILRPGQVYEDGNLCLQAFRSTDTGISAGVTFPDGTVCFHCGDLNNWYFEEDNVDATRLKVTLRQMEGMFLSITKDVVAAYKAIDYLMFPLDPRLEGQTARGARQWLDRMAVGDFYPMHYWNLYPQMKEALQELERHYVTTRFHLPPESLLDHNVLAEYLIS
ncbi:MAG: MBL fold metallo-hydrolase [Bacteroidales bacterium]|nr:MBL fold metallo-hydrolase [Bacteroidales bacterium]